MYAPVRGNASSEAPQAAVMEWNSSLSRGRIGRNERAGGHLIVLGAESMRSMSYTGASE